MNINSSIEVSDSYKPEGYKLQKIVHVITGLGDGGAEAVLYRLILSDYQPEEHIVISLLEKSKYGDLLENNNIKVFYMNMKLGLSIFSKIIKLYRTLKTLKPDVIQTWMYHSDLIGGILGRISGCRNIVWGIYCTNFTLGQTKFTTILIIFINALLSRFVPKKIICCANEGVKIHKKYGFPEKKLIYIPNGIPHETFTIDKTNNQSLKRVMNIDEKDIVLGIVGRYSPMKDHLNFIKALELLSPEAHNFVAIFIGENLDEDNSVLVDFLKKRNLMHKVRLLGMRDDIPKLMNLMDIKVLSSSFGEGQPNVLCESMLCGTPCVATDVGDAKLIVQDFGWVVPPSDHVKLHEAIASGIESMIDVTNWNKRSSQGRQFIKERFSIQSMTESYRSVWKE
mgnify:CR=1 FL=1